jgi:hypothetical protein
MSIKTFGHQLGLCIVADLAEVQGLKPPKALFSGIVPVFDGPGFICV